MTDLRTETVSCGVCDSTRAADFASGKDFEYYTSDATFKMVSCDDCGNIYLNPRPTADELPIIYPKNYYAYNYETAINPIALKAKDLLDARKIQGWLKHVKSAQPVFLDVGCGNGRYLRMLNKLGVPKDKLHGVDMSATDIDELNKDGFVGLFGRIEDVSDKLSSNSFDLIVLLQVLEHVGNPAEVMQCLAKLLRPGGVLIIETPNTQSMDVKMFKKSFWGGYHFPRHWNLFNKPTLSRLANNSGLRVKEFNFLPAHSFWILSFHHLFENRYHQKWLADLFNPLKNVVLLSVFTAFDIIRAKLGFQTSNIQCVTTKDQTG